MCKLKEDCKNYPFKCTICKDYSLFESINKKETKQLNLVENFGFPECPKSLKLGRKNEKRT